MKELLGHFRYHIYEVKLEGDAEETEYRVTCITRTFSDIRSGEEGEIEIHPFTDLRDARTAFENAVQYCLGRTSFTDVSLFQQQTTGLIR